MINIEIKGAEKVHKAFKKAFSLIDDKIDLIFDDMGKSTVKKSKENIINQEFNTAFGSNDSQLAKATRKARSKGIYWAGQTGVPDSYPGTALMHTGRLYNSIKYNKSAKHVEMVRYAHLHHKGFQQSSRFGSMSGKFIKRGFIEPTIEKEKKELAQKLLLKPIKRIFGQ